MAEHSELHAFMGHANPSLVRHAEASGGSHATGDVCDPRSVAVFARARDIDLAMVSADEPLAAGVVDALLAQGTSAGGPTKAGAEIEWNKAFARELLSEIAPEGGPPRGGGRGGYGFLRPAAGGVDPRGPDGGQGREGHGSPSGNARRGAGLRAGAARRAPARRVGPDRGEDARVRVHHPGDQRRSHD